MIAVRLRHPRAREDVPGGPPAKVDTADGTVPVDRDSDGDAFGTFDGDARLAERLADRFDLDRGDVVVDGDADGDSETDDDKLPKSDATLIEAGECPWCDDYEGEHVASHAASAHPDAWDAYNDDGGGE